MATITEPGRKFSLIPKKNRRAIYEYVFREGVLVVRKDPKLMKHPEIEAPNLHVMMCMKTLKSHNYVTEIFNWQHHYYVLTNDGIEFLRNFLHLPAGVFPAIVTKKTPAPAGGGRGGGGRGQRADFRMAGQ